jgi:hypothetical protein
MVQALVAIYLCVKQEMGTTLNKCPTDAKHDDAECKS